MIWTARLRIGRVVIFQANGSRAFKAAALIDLVAVADSAAIALVAEVDLAEVGIALVAADLGALADSVAEVADFGAAGDDEN